MCVAGSIFPCAPNDSRNEASQWPKTALTPLSGFDSRNARLGLTTFFYIIRNVLFDATHMLQLEILSLAKVADFR